MSKRWYHQHVSDGYVKKANQEGVRSRAAYKLLEIQKKYKFIKPHDKVIDLGSAPGAWSQVLVDIVGKQGSVVACDLLDMMPINGVQFIKGDFLDRKIQEDIAKLTDKYDVIVSDMSPNLTGNAIFDQANMLKLLNNVFEFAEFSLKDGGHILCKGFHGEMFESMLKLFKTKFKQAKVIKPDASKSGSKEIYFIGSCFGV